MKPIEFIILALAFIGTFLFRVIFWKDIDGGFCFGIINMFLVAFIMYTFSDNEIK